ncbi:MAG: hypothetical protein RhofKO_22030 [Rhodothermales bacterium]
MRIYVGFLISLCVLVPTGALAQRGYISELQHRTDSLFQLIHSVPRLDQPTMLKQLRIKVDSLRERHEASRAFMRRMLLGSGGSIDPLVVMADSAIETDSRSNKVLQDEYIAHLVVLDSLWHQYSGSTQSVLRPEDLLLVHEHLRGLEYVRATQNGHIAAYNDLRRDQQALISRKRYEETIAVRRQVMLDMPRKRKARVLERLDLEEALLQRLLR